MVGRKKDHLDSKKPDEDDVCITSVKYFHEEKGHYAVFKATGNISLKIKKDDILGKKLLTSLFLEANLLKQKDTAEIMNCQRLAVRQNLMKFRSSGTKGLLDNRRGQKSNYKFDNEVQAEIIKKFISLIFDLETPTKANIGKHLNEKFSTCAVTFLIIYNFCRLFLLIFS